MTDNNPSPPAKQKMDKNKLIIDLRYKLPWYRRYASTTSTALVWGIWLLLWRPIMLILGLIGAHRAGIAGKVLTLFLEALEKGMIILMLATLVLLVWHNMLPRKARKNIPAKTDQDYADYFHLEAQQLTQKRQQSIITVHHDNQGKITVLE